MRRCFVLLLLLVMPVQFVWASAAPYCAHESATSERRHFGHHEHQHQGGGEKAPAAGEQDDSPGVYHVDCEMCHFGGALTLPSLTTAIGAMPDRSVPDSPLQRYTSHCPSGPERPDRLELPSAARFGGELEFRPLSS